MYLTRFGGAGGGREGGGERERETDLDEESIRIADGRGECWVWAIQSWEFTYEAVKNVNGSIFLHLILHMKQATFQLQYTFGK